MTALKLPTFFGWSAIEPPKEWQDKDKSEIQSWHNQVTNAAEKNDVNVKTDIIESPMSVRQRVDSKLCRKRKCEPDYNWHKRKNRIYKTTTW
jgi:hypothetical protein